MKIGIDVTPILYEGTGVGEYTRQLVGELLRQNPDDEFVLFFSTLRGYEKIKEKIKEIVDNANQARHCERSEAIFLSNEQIATSSRLGGTPRNDNVHVVGVPLPPAVWQFFWNKLNLIKIEWLIGKVDIFHCWDYLIPPSNCPRVVTIHDVTPLLYPETHTKKVINNYKLIINKIKKEEIAVLTVSENSKKDLIKNAGLNGDLIHVVYNGKDESKSKASVTENKYGKYILCVGTREPRKNLMKAVEAFVELSKQYGDTQLLIVGRHGWGNDKLIINNEKLIINKHKIKILGFVEREKLIELYRHAICLVYPSFYEGFGLPVVEAMQFGCPVITSKTSSLPEVGGDAVLYVDPKNTEDIKNSMIRIIESDDLRHDLIEKGIKQAERFSWEKCAREVRTIYEKL